MGPSGNQNLWISGYATVLGLICSLISFRTNFPSEHSVIFPDQWGIIPSGNQNFWISGHATFQRGFNVFVNTLSN